MSSTTSTQNSPPEIIFVIGAPACGKGTLCKILEEKLGWCHVSVGDHLRELCEGEKDPVVPNYLSRAQLRHFMHNHNLVPSASIVAILQVKIEEEQRNGARVILLDGFPRQINQAEAFEEIFKPKYVLYFNCPRTIAKRRFVERNRESTDTEEVFNKRFDEFEREHDAIAEKYKDILRTVDTSRDTAEVKPDLLDMLGCT